MILNARVFFDAFYVCYASSQPSDHSFLPSRFYLPFFTFQRFITTTFPSRQPAKHRPAWRILVPIFMIQRCLHFVDTFEALIYYIRWYKLKKGGPTLSVDSPNIDQHKKSALLCSKALSGAPCGSKPEHFCVSGRHWHHAAAHPEVMPVVPPREDKRGVLKHQGAFAAYPRFANWAAVFHSPLDISPSLFF